MAEKKLWTEWPAGGNVVGDVTKVLSDEYQDHEEWARHYSVVRMTLGTFALTGAIGIVYQSWDKPADLWTALLGGLTLLAGMVLFAYFTSLTIKEMRHQRRIVVAYRKVIEPHKESPKAIGW